MLKLTMSAGVSTKMAMKSPERDKVGNQTVRYKVRKESRHNY